MQKITPHLWFDKNAEEAVRFYTSVFKNVTTGSITRYPGVGKEIHGMEEGTVLTIEFEIEGCKFVALNGGPAFTITPAISFTVNCETKEEVDTLWGMLSEGGKELMPLDAYPFNERYGWIQDKFGVSWQLIYRSVFEQKIVPSLLYVGEQSGKAEEAINLYTSIFNNSKIGEIARYGADQAPDKEGTITYAEFTLEGQKFSAMDSAHKHEFTFNEGVSLLVSCENQKEIDTLWEKLSAVPEAEQCGWLKDKFGVSWQIAPQGMDEVFNSPDKEKANRVMGAFLQMKKIDIETLRKVGE